MDLARLNRKTKAYSKSKNMLEISIELVIYKYIICSDGNSINKYYRYYVNEGKWDVKQLLNKDLYSIIPLTFKTQTINL